MASMGYELQKSRNDRKYGQEFECGYQFGCSQEKG